MKKAAVFAAMLMVAVGLAAPAVAASPVCLKTYFIESTHVLGPRTILFRMKNGQVWRNTLRTSCLGLKFSGFIYETHFDEICGNAQTIQVLNSNEICALGPFTPEVRGAPAGNS